MTKERYKELDNYFFYSVKDLDEFEQDEGIVRIGEWGYVTEHEYESQFKNNREQYEYQALSNSYQGATTENIEKINSMTDEELNDLLQEQNEDPDCAIYYTQGG